MNAKGKTISWGYFIMWFILACIGVVLGFIVFLVVMSALGEGGAIPDFAASLIMTAVPAQVAGVKEIVVVSPPRHPEHKYRFS